VAVATREPPESDWIHAVFEVLREELVAVAADFGDRVKHEVDQVAAIADIRPPSATTLLVSVAVETGNFVDSLLRGHEPPAAKDATPDDEETP
jgi:hypothetical protein